MISRLLKHVDHCFDKPPEFAVQYLEFNGITVSQSWKQQSDALKRHVFSVARVATAEAVSQVLKALQSAMAKGLDYRQFKQQLKAGALTAKVDWHKVFRMNMTMAYNAGRFIAQTAASGDYPYWRHNCPIDSRTRALGRALNGLVYRHDDPHWRTYYPPNEFFDRDIISTLTREEIEHSGTPVQSSPPVDSVGKPFVPSKGFDFNPALTGWKPDLSNYPPKIREHLQSVLGVDTPVTALPKPIIVVKGPVHDVPPPASRLAAASAPGSYDYDQQDIANAYKYYPRLKSLSMSMDRSSPGLMPAIEENMIREYLGSLAQKINRDLWLEHHSEELLSAEMILNRALSRLPDYRLKPGSVLLRSMNRRYVDTSLYARGKLVEWTGFSSVSTNKVPLWSSTDFVARLVNSIGGKNVRQYSESPHENEILFNSRLKLLCMSDPYMRRYHMIEARILTIDVTII